METYLFFEVRLNKYFLRDITIESYQHCARSNKIYDFSHKFEKKPFHQTIFKYILL